MKIASHAAGSSIKGEIFTPCHAVLFGIGQEDVENVQDFNLPDLRNKSPKINITLQNSATGKSEVIVPFADGLTLSEIATFGEGVVFMTEYKLYYMLLLNPDANLNLSNDKFLSYELILGDNAQRPVDVFAITLGQNSDFVARYDKLSVPAGTSRQSFDMSEVDMLALPDFNQGKFDSIRIEYKSGVVAEMTSEELMYIMSRANDVTAVKSSSVTGISDFPVCYSFFRCCVLNLVDVKSLTIVRDIIGLANNYEFVTVNLK